MFGTKHVAGVGAGHDGPPRCCSAHLNRLSQDEHEETHNERATRLACRLSNARRRAWPLGTSRGRHTLRPHGRSRTTTYLAVTARPEWTQALQSEGLAVIVVAPSFTRTTPTRPLGRRPGHHPSWEALTCPGTSGCPTLPSRDRGQRGRLPRPTEDQRRRGRVGHAGVGGRPHPAPHAPTLFRIGVGTPVRSGVQPRRAASHWGSDIQPVVD